MDEYDGKLNSDTLSSDDSSFNEAGDGPIVEGGEKPLDLSPNVDGKLMKTVVREGHGYNKPANGDKVSVHYVGQLTDGTVFDSSRDRGEQFSFTVGAKQVIDGWDLAVKSMRRGEVAKFVIAPELAYGETGAPPKIPASATLEFEIELFDWQLEDLTKKKDGGVTKRILKDGDGYATPNDGATCRVTVVGKHQDKVFERREDVTMIVGEGSEAEIVEGVELAVRKMKRGEVSEVRVRPEYAFGSRGKPEAGVPPEYEEVVYEVTLKDFEKMKEAYEMSNEERLEQAELAKNKGTKYFKEEKFSLALKQYKRIVQYLGPPDDFEADTSDKKKQLLLAGHLNIAMSQLKLKEFAEAVKSCSSALELDPNNVKGLFRRGQANFGNKDYELAKKDFERVLQLDKDNRAAQQQVAACGAAIRQQLERERKIYRNMFDRIFKQQEGEKSADTVAGK